MYMQATNQMTYQKKRYHSDQQENEKAKILGIKLKEKYA